MKAMRRVCATLLLGLFSFLLGSPLLIADTDSNLPACCRRLGQHHCAMPTPESSGPALHAARCASFPNALAAPISIKAGLVKARGRASGPILDGTLVCSSTGPHCQADPRYCSPQRGPPSLP